MDKKKKQKSVEDRPVEVFIWVGNHKREMRCMYSELWTAREILADRVLKFDFQTDRNKSLELYKLVISSIQVKLHDGRLVFGKSKEDLLSGVIQLKDKPVTFDPKTIKDKPVDFLPSMIKDIVSGKKPKH